jgi:hypothetical protein
MPKYLVLFNSTLSASETMKQATPEQMQASMQEWMQWKDMAEKKVKFEWGLPIQAIARITPTETLSGNNQASGYCTLEGSKEDVLSLLTTHPHLKREGATTDVLEMLSMPGM